MKAFKVGPRFTSSLCQGQALVSDLLRIHKVHPIPCPGSKTRKMKKTVSTFVEIKDKSLQNWITGVSHFAGTVWTASAHIITAVIGSGVLSLAWAIAQLGWIAGPATIFLFSFITFFTSTLLADCYRPPDPVYGKRNYTYTDAVRANLGMCSAPNTLCCVEWNNNPKFSERMFLMDIFLGGSKIWICGLAQYFNLFGLTIGYTITASISMA